MKGLAHMCIHTNTYSYMHAHIWTYTHASWQDMYMRVRTYIPDISCVWCRERERETKTHRHTQTHTDTWHSMKLNNKRTNERISVGLAGTYLFFTTLLCTVLLFTTLLFTHLFFTTLLCTVLLFTTLLFTHLFFTTLFCTLRQVFETDFVLYSLLL